MRLKHRFYLWLKNQSEECVLDRLIKELNEEQLLSFINNYPSDIDETTEKRVVAYYIKFIDELNN